MNRSHRTFIVFVNRNTTLTLLLMISAVTDCAVVPPGNGDRITVSVITELQRMRTVDHLYRPNDHRILQYSGFHRDGGNPDRMHCLYEEDGWRVIADHKGPGVATRIWATHGDRWHDIRIELDGKTLFEGRADLFFGNNQYPSASPLNEIRSGNSISPTMFRGTGAQASMRWGVSYLPLPFKSRLRYMQRDELYAHVDVKQLESGTEVESFHEVDWEKVRPEWEKTVAVWSKNSLYGDELQNYEKVDRTLEFAAATEKAPDTLTALNIDGPGIIRSVRVKVAPEFRRLISLKAWWDAAGKPSVDTSLDIGFGSRQYRTLAIGQSDDGWRFLNLPMPFRKSAVLRFVSVADAPATIDVEIYYEKKDRLPEETMYLNCSQHGDRFLRDKNQFLFPNASTKEFLYYNAYTAVDLVGRGHIAAYMDLFQCQPELDEHVFIDGERTFPENSWNGTGHEDLFDMAWGHKEHSAPMTSGGSEEQKEVNVRLFWNNTMTFRKDIRWNWEWSFKQWHHPPRDATFQSVVYWYGRPGSVATKRPAMYSGSE